MGLAAVVAGLAGCSSSDGDAGDGAASCPSVVSYEGTVYSEMRSGERLQRSEKLGTATVSGCDDTNDDGDEPDVQVDVWRLAGVDPGTAVAIDYGGIALYVADDAADVCAVKYTKCE
ncbi:MAG: putative secreted protein [Nocardioides sp.]|nr:putative secreted protein [Nocardioides sp.]